ncbi:hypothetical protein FKM82_029107 [Ascaphus truei]
MLYDLSRERLGMMTIIQQIPTSQSSSSGSSTTLRGRPHVFSRLHLRSSPPPSPLSVGAGLPELWIGAVPLAAAAGAAASFSARSG